MSLINDMLNDLEQNKDKNNQPKKLNENVQTNHSPEGTPDIPSSNKMHPPTMPPADEDEVKITIDSVDGSTKDATSQTESDDTEHSNFAPTSDDKVSIPDESMPEDLTPKENQTKHQQPWETGQTQTAKATDNSTDKPKINTSKVVEDKKPSHKRLIIWIVIIGIACIALAFVYLKPKSSEKATAESILGTVATPSKQTTQPAIEIKEDNQPTSAEADMNATPADKTTEAKTDSAEPASTTDNEATTTNASKANTHEEAHSATTDDTSHEQAIELKPVEVSPLVQAQTSYNQIMADIGNLSSYQAIEQMQQLLNEHPTFKPARTTLAAMLVKYGNTTQALIILEEGLKQSPADKEIAELTAHILVEKNDIKQALHILKRAQPATIQSDPDYYAFMAGLYIQEQDFAQAQDFYQALTRLNPQNGNWWAGLAISSEKLGQPQTAMDAYNKAETVGGLSPALQAYIEQTMQGS